MGKSISLAFKNAAIISEFKSVKFRNHVLCGMLLLNLLLNVNFLFSNNILIVINQYSLLRQYITNTNTKGDELGLPSF